MDYLVVTAVDLARWDFGHTMLLAAVVILACGWMLYDKVDGMARCPQHGTYYTECRSQHRD